MPNPFYDVMKILTNESHELLTLAKISSVDVFEFYKGCDLKGVDLSYQDLRGLNFAHADLRGANLDAITFDLGAFNDSVVDEKYFDITDNFDFYVSDISDYPLNYMSILYKFRKGMMEELLSKLRIFYGDFANSAQTSTGTLRRIRDGQAIANETVFGVVAALKKLRDTIETDGKVANTKALNILKQPCINVGYYDHIGKWHSLRRRELHILTSKLEFINYFRYGNDWKSKKEPYYWNRKPNTVEWTFK